MLWRWTQHSSGFLFIYFQPPLLSILNSCHVKIVRSGRSPVHKTALDWMNLFNNYWSAQSNTGGQRNAINSRSRRKSTRKHVMSAGTHMLKFSHTPTSVSLWHMLTQEKSIATLYQENEIQTVKRVIHQAWLPLEFTICSREWDVGRGTKAWEGKHCLMNDGFFSHLCFRTLKCILCF